MHSTCGQFRVYLADVSHGPGAQALVPHCPALVGTQETFLTFLTSQLVRVPQLLPQRPAATLLPLACHIMLLGINVSGCPALWEA